MNRVKEYRKRKRMTQMELASIIGVTQPTVSEWELQKKDPTGERLQKLCELFKCQVENILVDDSPVLPGYMLDHETIYLQERIRRNPEMQDLFEAADSSTPDQIQAAADMLRSPPEAQPPDTAAPKTIEARILSAGIDKMPEADRERALNLVRQIFIQYADYFERNDDDD